MSDASVDRGDYSADDGRQILPFRQQDIAGDQDNHRQYRHGKGTIASRLSPGHRHHNLQTVVEARTKRRATPEIMISECG